MSLLFSSYSFSSYSAIMAVVTAINLLVVLLAWRRRASIGARYLTGLFLGMAVSSFGYIFIYATTSTRVMALWFQFANIGFAVAGPLLLLFGLEYVQMGQHINWRLTAPLAIIVLATLVLTFTNDIHHQIFAEFVVNPLTGLGVLEGRGTWGWVQLAVIYICAIAVIVMLARAMLRFPPFYKVQIVVVLAATVLPTIGGIVSVLLQPMPGVEWTVLAFGLSGILLAVAILRQYMFSLIPLARAQLIDSMADGVVVLDTVDRIVDVNAPARHLLKFIGGELIGQPARKVLPVWPEFERGQGGVIAIPDATSTSTSPVTARHLEVHVSPLQDQFKRIIGRMFIL
ncbi:MAG TPA: histidine kinase N-terminal 7TM domain-containing protein, partial [Anaerolineae bacterium]